MLGEYHSPNMHKRGSHHDKVYQTVQRARILTVAYSFYHAVKLGRLDAIRRASATNDTFCRWQSHQQTLSVLSTPAGGNVIAAVDLQ